MAIDFQEKINFVTNFPELFSLAALDTYAPWTQGEWATLVHTNDDVTVDRLINNTGVSNVEIATPLNVGNVTLLEMRSILNGHGTDKVVLFEAQIGVSDEHPDRDSLWLQVSTAFVSENTTTFYNSVYVNYHYVNNGGLDVEVPIWSQLLRYEKNVQTMFQTQAFGLDFFTLPDREAGIANALLGAFVYAYGPGQSLNFQLTRYDSVQYRFPKYDNSGFGTDRYLLMLDLSKLPANMGYHFTSEMFSPEAGDPSGPGGMGQGGDDPTFDDSSDSIDLPVFPGVGVTNVGFVNVYKTGSNSLQNMGIELFPELQYTVPSAITGTDTTDAIINGFNAIVTFLANIPSIVAQSVASTLVNYIIDCHVLPVTPTTADSPENIKVGYKTLQATGYKVTSDYVEVDCGTINLGEFYANFADFSATSAKLFLPFVGFVPAKPEWFYRDSLNVVYHFNVIDGSFMAFVRSTGKYVNNNNSGKTIVGQYSGNACVHLPITGVTYASMVSGLVGAASGAVASAGSGSIAGAATSALNATNLHGDIPQSNAYSSSASFLGCRRPFLMIERAVSSFSTTYAKEIGIPSNISKKLGGVTGFAIVGDIHLDGITATDQEKNELERLLREGVIF